MNRILAALSLTTVVLIGFVVGQPALAGKYRPPNLLTPAPEVAGVDPLMATSWYLPYIGAPEAWKVTKGSPQTLIAIIDSGIDYNNADLAPNISIKSSELTPDGRDNDLNGFIDDAIGWNFSEEMATPWDDNGHGTFVAGIAAAREGNSVGGSGVCPRCALLPVRFLDGDGFGDTEDAIRGIHFAVLSGAKVINLSFAGEGYDKDLDTAIRHAMKADVVVVVSVGNDGHNADKDDIYPCKLNLPNMLTVAASRRDGDLWVKSNYSDKVVDLAAPGVNVWGPWSDGKWYRSQGTSFASPMVAGAVGLVRSANPTLNAEQVVEIIKSTVNRQSKLSKKVRTGGILNVERAVACAIDPKLPCLTN